MDHSSESHPESDSFGAPRAPDALVRWASRQCYPEILGFDRSEVDLSWWNEKLELYEIPITLLGRGPDGQRISEGVGEISRLDLFSTARYAGEVSESPFRWMPRPRRSTQDLALDTPRERRRAMLAEGPPSAVFGRDPGHLLTLLYLCAAFVTGRHRFREHRRSFSPFVHRESRGERGIIRVPDVLAESVDNLAVPGLALEELLRTDHLATIVDLQRDSVKRSEPNRGRISGSRDERDSIYYAQSIPGLGAVVASHFLGALSSAAPVESIAPVDPAAINMLVRCGWTEFGAETGWTRRRFSAYQEIVYRWAKEAGTEPDLVEMWLVASWNGRNSELTPMRRAV